MKTLGDDHGIGFVPLETEELGGLGVRCWENTGEGEDVAWDLILSRERLKGFRNSVGLVSWELCLLLELGSLRTWDGFRGKSSWLTVGYAWDLLNGNEGDIS